MFRLNLIFTLLLIFFLVFCDKDSSGDVGGLQMVTAKAGLNLRKEPSQDAEKIITIPYGTVVKIEKKQDEIIEIGGVKGRWAYVSIVTENPGKKPAVSPGWVFDAYLGEVRDVNCLSLDELEKTPEFYVNILDSSWYNENFHFKTDHTGVINTITEGRGTMDGASHPFKWKKTDDGVKIEVTVSNRSTCIGECYSPMSEKEECEMGCYQSGK
ncbi:MAG: SH3 domain-containing protein, partial [Spirochaetia bacterium]|nr:SH3 domain-containing protein [Spirochaetia bacterium]